jgi:bifunctional ADP-heptose synthase (sugar kinase/adenylyltransferase)
VAGAAFPQAARLANYGASVVVMKPGTATLAAEELKTAIAAYGKK